MIKKRAYAQLSADGAPVSAGQLAAAAGLSASYARALVAQFQARQPLFSTTAAAPRLGRHERRRVVDRAAASRLVAPWYTPGTPP